MQFLRDALITIVVIAGVLGIFVYARVRAGGLSADATPGAVERTVASRLVRLSIPDEAQQKQNPFAADANAWKTAADHYADHCAVCHGADGHGRTEMGENMYPKVPDLAASSVQGLSDGALFSIIQNGVRWTGMPAWKHEHSEEETWRLVSFMRKVPSLSSEDIEHLGGDHERHHDHQDHEERHEGGH